MAEKIVKALLMRHEGYQSAYGKKDEINFILNSFANSKEPAKIVFNTNTGKSISITRLETGEIEINLNELIQIYD